MFDDFPGEINPLLSDKAIHDFRLIRKALDEKEQYAYAELMGRYRDSIYYMMLKMVRNTDDAEDLTIEAFGKAFKSLAQYTPTYAFSTWLFRIASNNAIDFIRKQKLKTVSMDQQYENEEGVSMSFEIKSPTLDPEEKFIKKQKKRLLRLMVDKLKPRYRALVELRYFREFSYEEISKELKIPEGTVKAQLFRARDLLFNILKQSGDKI